MALWKGPVTYALKGGCNYFFESNIAVYFFLVAQIKQIDASKKGGKKEKRAH